jgi:Ca2+-binding EF-hand superfamily protein
MGCCSSRRQHFDPELEKIMDRLSEVFESLKISDADIKSIRKAFQKIDVTGGGTLELAELEVGLKIEAAPFNEMIFMMYDTDNSRELNLPEFIMMVWTFCSLDKNHLCKYTTFLRRPSTDNAISRRLRLSSLNALQFHSCLRFSIKTTVGYLLV